MTDRPNVGFGITRRARWRGAGGSGGRRPISLRQGYGGHGRGRSEAIKPAQRGGRDIPKRHVAAQEWNSRRYRTGGMEYFCRNSREKFYRKRTRKKPGTTRAFRSRDDFGCRTGASLPFRALPPHGVPHGSRGAAGPSHADGGRCLFLILRIKKERPRLIVQSEARQSPNNDNEPGRKYADQAVAQLF